MQYFKKALLMMVVVIACAGCDQATKSMAISHLTEMRPVSYFGDTLRLELTHNRGAFLSMGASLPDGFRHLALTLGVCILLVAISCLALFTRSGSGSGYFVLAASLIVGGGVGNLMDRICHDGSVVDFLNIGIGPLRTGIFNVADVAIVAGGIGLLFLSIRK